MENETERRALTQVLYHVGREIYILDAVDDLESDAKAGSFNAVASRFDIIDGKITEEVKQNVKTTLSHSEALASSAFELLETGMWSPILTNIIYLGIPWVAGMVLNSTWRNQRRQKEK